MEKQKKFALWIKKYGTYLTAAVLVVCLAGVVLITGLTSSSEKANTNINDPSIEVSTTPLTFSMPMTNATLIKDFSSDELYLNSTLGRWEFHDGIDLVSADLKVFAVADGEVLEVSENSLTGTTILVKHSDSLVSLYGSLNPDVDVQKGDKVKAGEVLGSADNTASSEAADGKHLHFSLIEDGKKIDPANYLEFEVK